MYHFDVLKYATAVLYIDALVLTRDRFNSNRDVQHDKLNFYYFYTSRERERGW